MHLALSWKLINTQVNKKLLYQESDLLDVGLVVQKARTQGGKHCYSGVL